MWDRICRRFYIARSETQGSEVVVPTMVDPARYIRAHDWLPFPDFRYYPQQISNLTPRSNNNMK